MTGWREQQIIISPSLEAGKFKVKGWAGSVPSERSLPGLLTSPFSPSSLGGENALPSSSS